jgi:hypothetical protein
MPEGRVLLKSNQDVIASVLREAISISSQEIASGRKNIGLRNDIKIGGARLCRHPGPKRAVGLRVVFYDFVSTQLHGVGCILILQKILSGE